MTNEMNYFEIGTADPAASKAFYGALFNWDIGEPSMPARYSMINENRGGLCDTSEMGAGNWAIFYVQVEDVQAAIGQAQQLGAAVVVPLSDNGRIEFAHLADPAGNRFGIWRPKTD
ncbi:MAG: VOC family protein [Pseudonocardiales bacterium]